MPTTSDREHALAQAMLDAIQKKVVEENYSDQEIFYALLEALCTRILQESNPAGLAQHVIDILRANFPPTEH